MCTKLPNFGIQSETLTTELVNLVEKFFLYIDLKIILVYYFKIKNVFNHKERLPVSYMSLAVYKFRYASCDAYLLD